MSRTRARLLALALSSGVAAVVIGVALWLRPDPKLIAFKEMDEEAFRRIAARFAAEGGGSDAVGNRKLTEDEVRAVLPFDGGKRVYDPFCYYVYKPGIRRLRAWPEHPDGEYMVVTNSIGIRRDGELLESPDIRVLVVGDSHIDGVCANSETLAGRLESMLYEDEPEAEIEVLNAAHGAYSFFHYLGVLERFLHLGHRPDLFVMVVYGGNDFMAALQLWHLFRGEQMPVIEPKRRRIIKGRIDDLGPAIGQVVNSVEYFRSLPREIVTALQMGFEVTLEVRRVCRENGVDLLVVYLPAPSEVPETADLRMVDELAAELGLTAADFSTLGELADRYLAALAREGIETLDLREPFRGRTERLYWRADLHLGVAGHRVAAEAAWPWFRGWRDGRDD